ncbi:hypothetical protein GN244_ATG13361 [Phytophthora infestans]|uniref:Uncharacterized protein n=1 Tax=Phytophthora infestans TaxID=4787 RepID=A0A833SP72_PHYIN|nr:hypothetical protein GN244_ATG13361 [Phytophthora infestans]
MGSLRNLATISDDRKDIEHAIGSQNKALSTNSRLSIDGRLRAVQASLHPLLLKIGFGDTSKCRYPTVVESAQFLELVRHGNYSHIVNAVRALMNLLRRKPESKSAIVAARVIPQLFAVVRAGNGAQVVSAAKARSKLTDNDDTAKIISDEGDMAILVDLLGYDDDCGKEQAVLSLLDTAGKRKTEADVGGVPLLSLWWELLSETACSSGSSQCAVDKKKRRTIADADGIPVLLGLIRDRNPDLEEFPYVYYITCQRFRTSNCNRSLRWYRAFTCDDARRQ